MERLWLWRLTPHERTRLMVDIPIGRKGKYGVVTVEREKLPEHIHDHIWLYGIRQILNDAVSDKTDLSDGDVFAKAQAKLDQLYEGIIRTRGIGKEPLDPVEAEAYKMAKEALEKAFRKVGLWPKNGTDKFQRAVDARRLAQHLPEMDEADFIAEWLDKNPDVRKAAERVVKARAVKIDDDDVLGSAGL